MTEALARTGFFHSREGYFLKGPSKSDLPVNVSVSRIHTEPEPVGLVVARDISDRKQAEEALKQVEARYNSLVASTGVMVWEIDAAGVLVSISPAFRDHHRLVEQRLDRPPLRRAAPPRRSRNGDANASSAPGRAKHSPATSCAYSNRDRGLPGSASSCWSPRFATAPPSAVLASSATSPNRSGTNRPSSRPTRCGGPRKKPNGPIGPRASSSRASAMKYEHL